MSCRHSYPTLRNISPSSLVFPLSPMTPATPASPVSSAAPASHDLYSNSQARRSISSGTFLLRASLQQPEHMLPQMDLRKRYSYRGHDRSQRRRSANADILESIGLPTTGSFNDMKSLQGSTLFEYDMSRDEPDEGHEIGGCCGLGSAAKAIQTRLARAGQKTDKTDKAKAVAGDTIPDPSTEAGKEETEKKEVKGQKATWKKMLALPAVGRLGRKRAGSSATAQTAVDGSEMDHKPVGRKPQLEDTFARIERASGQWLRRCSGMAPSGPRVC